MEIGSDHGIHGAKASTPEDADQSAQQSGHDENQGYMPPVVDTNKSCALLIAAERVEVSPCPGKARRQPKGHVKKKR